MSKQYHFRSYMLLFFIAIATIAIGQIDTSQIQLTNKTNFVDGVYHQQNWTTNQPDWSWEEVDTRLFINEKNGTAHIEYIKAKQPHQPIEVTAIVKKGKLYLDIPNDESSVLKKFKDYGALCYYEKDTTYVKDIEMSAYNPLTGRPFRTKTIQREITERQAFFYNVKTREYQPLTLENLLKAISTDKKLTKSILALPPEEARQKLYKTLLIYNDRNPIYIPQ